MTFEVKDASKTWNKAYKEKFLEAYLQQQEELQVIQKQIQEHSNSSRLITKEEYLQDFQLRFNEHQKEISFLKDDVEFLARWISGNIKKLKAVELPSFLK